MKILFLARRFYPSIGGVEKHVLEISKELVRKGHKVTIITEMLPKIKHTRNNVYQSIGKSDRLGINSIKPVKSVYSDNYETDKIKVVGLNFGENNFFKKFRIWWELLKNIRILFSADVVHCHDVFIWYLPFRFLFPLKKVFTTFHGHETKFPPTLKSKVIRKVSEMLSNGNICVGRYIEKWYGTKSDNIIYGGVRIEPIKRKDTMRDKKTLKILFLGRIDRDNGIYTYIKVLNALKKNRSLKVSFIAIGNGADGKKMQKIGKVMGFIANPIPYIDKSDFVFASSYLSILEAFSRKKPVVAVYENDIKKDYLLESPCSKFLIIDENVPRITQRIINLYNNPRELNKKVNESYEWVRNQSWTKIVNIYLKLWQKK